MLIVLCSFVPRDSYYLIKPLSIMKKLSLLVVLFSFLFVACADKKPKTEKVETTTEMEIQEVDTMLIDSLATELEQTKDDIEEAAKEVDQLLEEL